MLEPLPFRDVLEHEEESGHDQDKDHGHEDEHDHDHDSARNDDHAHDHDGADPHLWLDPVRAGRMVQFIAAELAKVDPDNASTYSANAAQTVTALEELDTELNGRMMPLSGKPFLVFHDGYQYFETRYDLDHKGAVHIDPERPASAARIKSLQERVSEEGIACLFSEPQFNTATLERLSENIDARIVSLDPLGHDQPAGPDHYFKTLRAMAESFETCIAG